MQPEKIERERANAGFVPKNSKRTVNWLLLHSIVCSFGPFAQFSYLFIGSLSFHSTVFSVCVRVEYDDDIAGEIKLLQNTVECG